MKIELPNPYRLTQMLPDATGVHMRYHTETYKNYMEIPETALIYSVLEQTDFDVPSSAKILAIPIMFLEHRIDKLHITRATDIMNPPKYNVVDFQLYLRHRDSDQIPPDNVLV